MRRPRGKPLRAQLKSCLTLTRPMKPSPSYKGNKQFLPSKPCVACGRAMSWRKKWEKNWEQVKYCSEACRRAPAAP